MLQALELVQQDVPAEHELLLHVGEGALNNACARDARDGRLE